MVCNTDDEELWPSHPHQHSYFVPGRVGGRQVQCLIDWSCTTNILSKHCFDRLPTRLRERMEVKHTHGTMADETQLPFYGVIQLEVRTKGLCLEEVFVVGRVSEDLILGMPFLSTPMCHDIWGPYH